jgi:hypothetical protein
VNSSRLKIGNFNEVPSKITTNYMENELMLLQQKIAGLEKKLTNNGVSSISGRNAPQRLPEELTNNSENSRLEINLSKYEHNQDVVQLQPTEVDTTRISESGQITRNNLIVNSNFHSDRSINHTNPTKKPRRSESVTVKNIKSNLPHVSSGTSKSKKKISCAKSITSHRSAIKSVDGNSSVRNSSKETNNSKRYMQPTGSSRNKLHKTGSKLALKAKIPISNALGNRSELRNFAKHPFALVMLFRSFRYYRGRMMLDPENKVLKLIYYVFAPYILAILIIMKNFIDQNQKIQSSYKKSKFMILNL